MSSREEIKNTILNYIDERGRDGDVPSIKEIQARLREIDTDEDDTSAVIGEIISGVRNMLQRGEIVEPETLAKNLRRLPIPPSLPKD